MSSEVPSAVPGPQPQRHRPEQHQSPGDAVADATWHRLHPLSPLVRAGRQLVSLVVVLAGIAVLKQHQAGSDLVTDLVVIGVALAGGFVSWLVTRWQISGGVLRVDTGLVRRNSQRFPLSQIQAVDVVQSGLARVFGLAELQLRMAGGGAAGSGRLACLSRADAEQLRARLLSMGALAPVRADTPAGGPGASMLDLGAAAGQERLLFRVRSRRLPGAVVLGRAGAIAAATGVAIWLTAWLSGSVSTITPFLTVIFGVVVSLWRQFNGEFGTKVSAAPDGIRLRSGLIQTAAETIRPGRIQAVRLVEPLIWRAFGWCRLEVDVAGGRQRREDRPEGQRLRAIIPVGTRAEAREMIGALLGASPVATARPPRAARWKAPLSYHFLAWNSDDRYVVAVRGRICRQTTWVPLQKVQSIRWVQGPVQRRLGLASVNLDVAGKRVTLSIRERSAQEAHQILGRMPDLARAARTAGR